MREERFTLTKKEHERLAVVRQVMRRELKQKVAAELLVTFHPAGPEPGREGRTRWSPGAGPREPGQALAEADGPGASGPDRCSRQGTLSGLQAEVRGREAVEEGQDQGQRREDAPDHDRRRTVACPSA